VHDDAAPEKVRDGLARHGLDPAIVNVHGGGLDATALGDVDLIVLSPGVPRAHPALAAALERVPCVNELELGLAQLALTGGGDAGIRVWAITGTNGKSTTTTMAGAIARARDPDAFVGGNLGTPLCAAVADGLVAGTPQQPRILVVELSSYQLETLHHLPVHAAAFTNLSPDHLDRYASADAYYAAKARLFELVVPGGGISLNARDGESRRCLQPHLPGLRATCHFDVPADAPGIEINGASLVARPHGLTLRLDNPLIVGHHNRQNAAAASALALLDGFDAGTLQRGLDAYAGIAHRLERVGALDGVTWWNDSKATNVDAAVTALRSFARIEDGGGVHLIAGGLGKGAPYAPLVDESRGRVVAVYTIGKDAPAIASAFDGVVEVVACNDLDTACRTAARRARSGEHIVLTPACASFDQFRDYAHRGESFRAAFAQHAGPTPAPASDGARR
jgi:UDP-N-acetylmuramoylalanine--D-glutamate ligase